MFNLWAPRCQGLQGVPDRRSGSCWCTILYTIEIEPAINLYINCKHLISCAATPHTLWTSSKDRVPWWLSSLSCWGAPATHQSCDAEQHVGISWKLKMKYVLMHRSFLHYSAWRHIQTSMILACTCWPNMYVVYCSTDSNSCKKRRTPCSINLLSFISSMDQAPHGGTQQ